MQRHRLRVTDRIGFQGPPYGGVRSDLTIAAPPFRRQRARRMATVRPHLGTLLAEAKPLALRKIMQDLGKNMQVVTDGISREDWELMAKIAPLVADHPQPPLTEKMRILSFVGADAGKRTRKVMIEPKNVRTTRVEP